MLPDVLIVGAGVAGLAAAIDLSRVGLQVEIIEARDRVGGRILTKIDRTLNHPVELGAEFVHGLAPEIWLPVQQHGLRVAEVSGDLWCSSNGKLQPCDFFEEVDKILSAMNDSEPDESFLQFLSRRFPGDDHGEAKPWATGYVRGFNAADPAEVSVHWLVHNRRAEEQIDGDRAFRIEGGYAALVDLFVRELREKNVSVRLNVVASEIQWSSAPASILAQNEHGDTVFKAPRVLVTVPLGVLQSQALSFQPHLPELKQAALRKLVMGKVVRVVLCFREPFWQVLHGADGSRTLGNLSFLFSQDDLFPTWWTQAPERVPLITGWAPAGSAEQLAGLTEDAIADKALKSLAGLLNLDKPEIQKQLVAAHFHDWDLDPFSCGAYSYVNAGGEGCQGDLAAPLGDVLFFAGEATDTTGHNGTVQGATASGHRAAKEILRTTQ